MKIALFGRSSILGQKFIKTALDAGHGLKIIHPRGAASAWNHSAVESCEVDFSNPETFAVYLKDQDVIVHLVAPEEELRNLPANQASARWLADREKILRAAARAGIGKVILMGDAGLFAPADPEADAMENNPISDRGYGRVVGPVWDSLRSLCRETRLGTRVHPGKIYGPSTWFQRDLVEPLKFKGRAEMVGSGANWISPLHVHDAAQGLLLAAEKGKADADYLLAAEPVRWSELIHLTMSYMGCQEPPRAKSIWLSRLRLGRLETEATILSCRVKTQLPAQELGWSPVYAALKEGIPHALKDLGALAWN